VDGESAGVPPLITQRLPASLITGVPPLITPDASYVFGLATYVIAPYLT
jgi:hypothetical protein